VSKAAALVGGALVVGLLAGGLLDVITFFVARYGPESGHWSFRGNGALAVPFGLGPVMLAAGWGALVWRCRGFQTWLQRGLWTVVGGSVLFVLLVIFVFAANADLTLFLVAAIVAVPVFAGFQRSRDALVRRGGLAEHIGAGVAFAVALALGFYASELVLPPGS
jgi:hypothetical protein